MGSMSILGMGFMWLFWVAVWLMPVFFIAQSDRISGNEKIAWVIGTLLFWLLWVAYLLLAPINKEN